MDLEHQLLKVANAGSAWVLYLLLALSAISIAVIVERILYFRRHRGDPARLRERLAATLSTGDLAAAEDALERSPTFEARVVRRALAWRHGGAAAVSDAIDSELAAARKDLERGLNFLGTLGNNAPFVGLFGTVLGVIEAFNKLAGGPSKDAMNGVMGGIAGALVATGVGIFVALPAVVAFNKAQKKIGDVETQTQSLAKLVTAYLETQRGHLEAEGKPVRQRSKHPTLEPRGGLTAVGAD